jgi:hypothetical protein
MTLGNTIGIPLHASQAAALVTPVSGVSNWVVAISNLLTADNGGSAIVNPILNITQAFTQKIKIGSSGTVVRICVAYEHASAVSQNAVIQPFGLDEANIPQKLLDVDDTHEQIMTVNSTTDARGTLDLLGTGTAVLWAFSVVKEFDLQGSPFLLLGIKTPAIQASSKVPILLLSIK